MKGPVLTDLFQVTRIRYNPETTRIDMWTGKFARHRHKLNFTHQRYGTREQMHLVGDKLGLNFVINMMEVITGKKFIYDGTRDLYFREDIQEDEKNLVPTGANVHARTSS